MARTPLFRNLIKTLTQHYYVGRYSDLRNSSGDSSSLTPLHSTRRQAIGAGAALSLAGCASASTKGMVPSISGGERVVVVGAGLAGVHCAYRLKQVGLDVALYEAANRTGGRTFSSQKGFFDGGQVCELGGELIDTDHVVMQSFAKEFNLQLDNLPESLPADVSYGYQYNVDGAFLTQQQVIEAYQPVDQAVQKINYAFSRIEEESPEKLDQARIDYDKKMTLLQFLEEAGANETCMKVIRFAFVGEFGLEMEEQSVFNLLDMFPCSANIGACVASYELVDGQLEFRPFGNSDEIKRYHDGNQGPARAMTKGLRKHVFLEHALTKLDHQNGRYFLEFTRSNGEVVRDSASQIVLALPFSTLRNVDISASAMSAANLEVVKNVSYGTNAKLMGQFKTRAPWRSKGQDGSLVVDRKTRANVNKEMIPSRYLHNLWDTSRGQEGEYGLWTNFVGGKAGFEVNTGTAEEQWQTMLPVLDTIYPGVKEGFLNKAVRMAWPEYKWVKGSYMAIKPGELSYATDMPTEDKNGTLQFCGEHTSGAFQGFMEGAAETGARAAINILKLLGQEGSPELQQIEALMAQREQIQRDIRRSLLAAIGRRLESETA